MTDSECAILGDLCNFTAGNAFKTKFQGNATGDIPFIKVSDFELPENKYKINHANNWISDELALSERFKRHRAGGVVFAKIGVALTSNRRRILSGDTIIDNNLMCATAKENCCDPLFLYYLLSNLDFNLISSGSAIPYLTVKDLREISVPYHSNADQKAIAHILGTLDDKIELNRQMNETLEEIAKAIFKSWFVDFDPVRAKMEGRPTGLPDDIATLFPDRLVDSEIGEISEGWAVGCVSEIAELNRKTLSPSKTGDLYEHFSIPAYDNDASPSIDLGADIKSNKTVVPPEAVLVSKLNPDTPRVWLPRAASDLDQICSTEFMVFTSKGLGSRSFVWSLFCAQSMIAYMKSLVTGTSKSHQRVKPNDILAAKIVLSDSALIGAFSNVVDPIIKRRFVCSKESETLADLRDTLLPKLIAGELQVPDAEKFLEEAGI